MSLWKQAPDDAAARAVLVRDLLRRNDPRAELLRPTLSPPSVETWVGLLRQLEAFGAPEELRWLEPFLSHWPDACRVPLHPWKLALMQGDSSSPWLSWCRHVSFFGGSQKLDLDSARALARAPALRPIRHWTARQAGLGPQVLRVLLESPHLGAGLEALDLGGNDLEDDAITVIAAAPHLGDLELLDLGSNAIRAPGAAALAQSETLLSLRHLKLSHNRLFVAGMRALAEGGGLSGLEALEISRTGAGDAGLAALARAPALSGLRTLMAPANGVGDQAALALGEGGHGLRVLHLGDNLEIGDTGAHALASLSQIEVLMLHRNAIGDPGAYHLARLGPPTLRHLSLTRTRVTVMGALALIGSERLTGLETLALERLPIGASEAAEMAAATWSRPLKELFLTRETLGVEGATAVVVSNVFPRPLRERCLGGLKKAGLKAVARRLKVRGVSRMTREALVDRLRDALGWNEDEDKGR